MAIKPIDIKLLWGRAAGKCSYPDCNEDLTTLIENNSYTIGEMAHIIGRKPSAARGTPSGGTDTYDNLILLLCPTHHTHIDKAPEGTYTIEILHEWKKTHEDIVKNIGKTSKFNNFNELRIAIAQLLIANKSIFDNFGPLSLTAQNDPNSNAFKIWELKRSGTILPNNRKILNIIDFNNELIKDIEMIRIIEDFRIHAESYESHVYDRLDSYPLFPNKFSEVFLEC